MELFNDKGLQSYKDYFINKLFETLMNHAVCLKSESSQDKVQDLLMKSELKNKTLWKHTELQDVLSTIFQER